MKLKVNLADLFKRDQSKHGKEYLVITPTHCVSFKKRKLAFAYAEIYSQSTGEPTFEIRRMHYDRGYIVSEDRLR